MALTNYPGLTTPSTSTSGIIYPGSAYLVWVLINGAGVTVTSVAVAGLVGMPFSFIGAVTVGNYRLEAWGSAPSTTQQNTANSPVATLSGAATASTITYVRLKDVSSFGLAGNNSGVTTAWSVTAGPTTIQNSCTAFALGQVRPANATNNNLGITRSTPAPISLRFAGSALDASTTLDIKSTYGTTEGAGVVPAISGTQTIAPTQWLGLGVYINGPTVSMDDLTYMLGEGGTLINNPNNVVPLFDLESIEGLDDATATSSSSEVDGADGSYVAAKFLAGKTIVIDGILYDNPPIPSSRIDNLKTLARPTSLTDGLPFFYKLPSTPLRRIMVKPISFKCPLDRQRTLGKAPFQLQMLTTDVRSFSPLVSGSMNVRTTGTYATSIATGGNIETYPVFYFTHYAGDGIGNNHSFANSTWDYFFPSPSGNPATISVSTTVNGTALPTGVYKLDTGSLTLTRLTDGLDYSSYITTRRGFGLVNGYSNAVNYTRPAGTTITDEGFSWVFGDAWF